MMSDPGKTVIMGTVTCFVRGDDSGAPRQFDMANLSGALYLVASYLRARDTGALVPAQLIPMGRLPHRMLADDFAQVTSLIPRELFDQAIPPALQLEYGVVDAPELLAIPPLGPIQ
jgi:hypothetical protein